MLSPSMVSQRKEVNQKPWQDLLARNKSKGKQHSPLLAGGRSRSKEWLRVMQQVGEEPGTEQFGYDPLLRLSGNNLLCLEGELCQSPGDATYNSRLYADTGHAESNHSLVNIITLKVYCNKLNSYLA